MGTIAPSEASLVVLVQLLGRGSRRGIGPAEAVDGGAELAEHLVDAPERAATDSLNGGATKTSGKLVLTATETGQRRQVIEQGAVARLGRALAPLAPDRVAILNRDAGLPRGPLEVSRAMFSGRTAMAR